MVIFTFTLYLVFIVGIMIEGIAWIGKNPLNIVRSDESFSDLLFTEKSILGSELPAIQPQKELSKLTGCIPIHYSLHWSEFKTSI